MQGQLLYDDVILVDNSSGEEHELGTLKDVVFNLETFDKNHYLEGFKTATMGCTLKASRSAVYLLDIRAGVKCSVPNNWLKRHKFPMNRRIPND